MPVFWDPTALMWRYCNRACAKWTKTKPQQSTAKQNANHVYISTNKSRYSQLHFNWIIHHIFNTTLYPMWDRFLPIWSVPDKSYLFASVAPWVTSYYTLSCRNGTRVMWPSGGRFKKACELLNLRALKFSPVNKMHIFQCMVKIFCVEFQRIPLKFHTKYFSTSNVSLFSECDICGNLQLPVPVKLALSRARCFLAGETMFI